MIRLLIFYHLHLLIWIEDAEYIKEKINNIFFQTTQREESGQIADKKEIVMTGNNFIDQCRKFRMLEIRPEKHVRTSKQDLNFRQKRNPFSIRILNYFQKNCSQTISERYITYIYLKVNRR